MKLKKLFCSLLAAAVSISAIPVLAVETDDFIDVEKNSQLYGAVNLLKDSGIVNGVGGDRYAPDMTVTRADFAVIADKAFEFDKIQDVTFSDVFYDDYYQASVNNIASAGIINGYDDGTFKPKQVINKQEAAVILVRIYEELTGKKVFANCSAKEFIDYNNLAQWSKSYIDKAYFLGLIDPIRENEIGAIEPFSRGDTAIAVSRLIMTLNDRQEPDFNLPTNIIQWNRGNIFVGDETMGFTLETGNDSVEYIVTDYYEKIIDRGIVPVRNGKVDFTFENYAPGYYEVDFYSTDDSNIKHKIKKTSMCLLEEYDFDSVDPESSAFGINMHCDRGMTGWAYDHVEEASILGAKHIRDGYEWSGIETTKGNYTALKSRIEEYYDRLNAHNMSIIIVTGFNNKFYDNGATPYTDEGRKAYANFSKSFYDLYEADQAQEIYNEFWGPQFGDRGNGPADGLPEYYAPLLKTVYETIKKEHPDATLSFCVGHNDWSGYAGWRRDLFKLGALEYCDVINLHQYGGVTRISDECVENVLRVKFDELKNDIMEFAPDKMNLPMWNTETGGNTSTNNNGSSEETIAQHIPRIYALNVAAGIERVYFYDLVDDGNTDSEHEDRFGLLRAFGSEYGNYTPKPSFVSYSVLARQLTGMNFVSNKNFENGVEWNIFKGNGKTVNMLNTRSTPTEQVYVDTAIYADSDVVITDIMGNKKTYTPVNGKIYLTLNGDALYIEGIINDIKEEKAVTLTPDTWISTGVTYNIMTSGSDSDLSSNMTMSVDGNECGLGNNMPINELHEINTRKVVFELKHDGVACGRLIEPVTSDEKYSVSLDVILQLNKETSNYETIVKTNIINHSPNAININSVLLNIDGVETEHFIDEVIDANQEKTVPISVGAADFGSSHNIYARMKIDGEMSSVIDASGKFQYRGIEEKTIVVDGVLDEGIANGRSLSLEKDGERFALASDGSKYNGAEDLSGTVWITYDNENLYITADIVDANHNSAAVNDQIWKNDCIQIDFHQHQTEAYSATKSYSEIGVSLLDNGEVGLWAWKSVKSFEDKSKPDGVIAAVKRDEKTKHIVYEVALSWDETAGIDINNIDRIDLSIAVNDCDKGIRKTAVELGGGIIYSKSPDKYNKYSLIR